MITAHSLRITWEHRYTINHILAVKYSYCPVLFIGSWKTTDKSVNHCDAKYSSFFSSTKFLNNIENRIESKVLSILNRFD